MVRQGLTFRSFSSDSDAKMVAVPPGIHTREFQTPTNRRLSHGLHVRAIRGCILKGRRVVACVAEKKWGLPEFLITSGARYSGVPQSV